MTDRPGRIPCIRPGCRRTAPKEKFGDDAEIVCGKCWRTYVPPRLKHRYKLLNAELRRLNRRRAPDLPRVLRVHRLGDANWQAIRASLVGGAKPAGLGAFLEGTGL